MAVCEHGIDSDSNSTCVQCSSLFNGADKSGSEPRVSSARRGSKDRDAKQKTRRNLYVLAFTIVAAVLVFVVVITIIRRNPGPPRTAAEWCNSDATAIATAVAVFDTQNKSAPIAAETYSPTPRLGSVTPGKPATYATATQARRLVTAGYLSGWPSPDRGYSISLATAPNITHGALAGDPMIYIGSSAIPYDFALQSGANACNQL